MDTEQLEALLQQACCEGVIEIECPLCGALIIAEPDAHDLYCQECEKATMRNPLTTLGLI
ncbi:MAG: hypothetical protein KAT27_01940 [Desulfobacterales bacterium]|nr:hypothetical protein [Desulfobacterales bacterium]